MKVFQSSVTVTRQRQTAFGRSTMYLKSIDIDILALAMQVIVAHLNRHPLNYYARKPHRIGV